MKRTHLKLIQSSQHLDNSACRQRYLKVWHLIILFFFSFCFVCFLFSFVVVTIVFLSITTQKQYTPLPRTRISYHSTPYLPPSPPKHLYFYPLVPSALNFLSLPFPNCLTTPPPFPKSLSQLPLYLPPFPKLTIYPPFPTTSPLPSLYPPPPFPTTSPSSHPFPQLPLASPFPNYLS